MLQASSKSRKGTDCCEELWRRLAPVVSSAEGDESKSDDELSTATITLPVETVRVTLPGPCAP